MIVNHFTFHKSLPYVQWLWPIDDVHCASVLSVILMANMHQGIVIPNAD